MSTGSPPPPLATQRIHGRSLTCQPTMQRHGRSPTHDSSDALYSVAAMLPSVSPIVLAPTEVVAASKTHVVTARSFVGKET